MTDIDRVREAFSRRDADPVYQRRHADGDPAHDRAVAERTALVRRVLDECGHASLRGKRVLDVGCGIGDGLTPLADEPWQLRLGLDVSPDRLERARARLPNARFAVADGCRVPLRPKSFDVVLLFTVLTALDRVGRRALIEQVLPLLRVGGVLFIYDFRRYPGRERGVGPQDVRALLADRVVQHARLTLAPPLARAVAPRAPRLADALERVPFLRTHDLYWTIEATA